MREGQNRQERQQERSSSTQTIKARHTVRLEVPGHHAIRTSAASAWRTRHKFEAPVLVDNRSYVSNEVKGMVVDPTHIILASRL